MHESQFVCTAVPKKKRPKTGDRGVGPLRRIAVLASLLIAVLYHTARSEGAILISGLMSTSVLPVDCCVLDSCRAAFQDGEFSYPLRYVLQLSRCMISKRGCDVVSLVFILRSVSNEE